MIEQRAAGHPHQRLRHLVGQRPHAHAETGGEDHGFGGLDGHFWKFLEPVVVIWRDSYHGIDSAQRMDRDAIVGPT